MKKIVTIASVFLMSAVLLGGCSGQKAADTAESSAAETSAEASEASQSAAPAAEAAALADGEYTAEFHTDSSMFTVNEACEGKGTLTVKDGQMTIHVSLVSEKIVNLYPGLAEDAEKEGAVLLEPSVDTVTYKDGSTEEVYGFDVPVPYLDQEFDLAIFGTKGKWYDHKVSVDNVTEISGTQSNSGEGAAKTASSPSNGSGAVSAAGSVLNDGTYEVGVTLEGGSGKASVKSPAEVTVKDGKTSVKIVFTSKNYDYMNVDGKKLEPVSTDDGSAFIIELEALPAELSISADTVAMSTPHLIDYVLKFDLSSSATESTLAEAGKTEGAEASAAAQGSAAVPSCLKITGHKKLEYADQFTADYCDDESIFLTIGGTDRYLLVKDMKNVPEGLDGDVIVIRQRPENIYLAASSAMDMFRELDALSNVKMTSTSAENWSMKEISDAVTSGQILYVGKYSAPDYETLLAENCDLAVESTMVYHVPEVQDQLEDLGIPVLVERSSYEEEPLGRMEWIKLYGILTGNEEKADQFFEEKAALAEKISNAENTGKTAAFFYIGSNGSVNVRCPGDYITKMIHMAGADYAFDDLDTAGVSSSTVNMDMETFYAGACDADILIYNCTVTAELTSLKDLTDKSSLLKDFKAVKSGNVWCTEQNMFQQTTCMADMISEFHTIMSDNADENSLRFLYKLK